MSKLAVACRIVARVLGPAPFVFLASIAFAQVPTAPVPGSPAQLPPRDAQQQQTGTAIMRGRVIAADTGTPLRRAQVRISAPALREQRMTSTDAEGRYEFKELPAGRYNLNASKGSYVSMSYGQRRPFEPGQQIELSDGQTLEKVDMALPLGGVITGKIIDEYGDPVANAQVNTQRYVFQQGRRQLVPRGYGQTNDIGEYRVFGLPPGDYYVSASIRNVGFGAVSDDRSGYASTYYPGTPNIAEAQKVTVPVGQTVGNVNMALVATRVARISGDVVDADGRAASRGSLILFQREGAMVSAFMGTQVRPDGTFTISNVAPGDYTLRATLGLGLNDIMSETATVPLTVSGDDIEGVHLAIQPPAVATGRIVLEGAMPGSNVRASTFHVNATLVDPTMMFGPQSSDTVHDDFTFDLKIRPCHCLLRSFIGGAPAWFLKAVRLNDVDVTDTGIDFRAGQEISGIEVVFTNHPAELSGLVTDAKGQPSRDYTLVLFAQDRDRWNPGTRYVTVARPDQDGRYKVRGIAPGDYYAIAVDYVEQGQWTDPDYLDRVRAGAASLTIADGETKTLDLKVVTGS